MRLDQRPRGHKDRLHLARILKEQRPDAASSARDAWGRELRDRPTDQGGLWRPLAGGLFAKPCQEHREIERLIGELPGSCAQLGLTLEFRIRWRGGGHVPLPRHASQFDCRAGGRTPQGAFRHGAPSTGSCPGRAEIVQRRIERLRLRHHALTASSSAALLRPTSRHLFREE